jgi:SNF2 family DNA or RNA helicase
VLNFQNPNHPLRFFVGNPATAGYGLTLTEANLVVYYANDFNLETRIQSEDRAHRIGQHKPVTYVDILAEDTVDEKIVKALRKKINIASEENETQSSEFSLGNEFDETRTHYEMKTVTKKEILSLGDELNPTNYNIDNLKDGEKYILIRRKDHRNRNH